MKNLITYLKALWSRVADSQSTDVSLDRRLTVDSPSGLDAKWKQNPFMRFAVVLTLIFTIGSGNVWGDTYTITFNTGSGDGTKASTSTAASTCTTAATYVTGNLVTASNTYYSGESGLKLGTSSGAGDIKFNLSSDGQVVPTKVSVYAKYYSSSKKKTVQVCTNLGSNTATTTTGSFAEYSYSYSGSTKLSYIEIKSSGYIWVEKVVVTYAAPAASVATPTFSPAAGTYEEAQSVTISCATAGTTIYYTTDGSTPTSSSSVYSSAVSIASSCTLKAIAKKGSDYSSVGSAAYVIKKKVNWSVNGENWNTGHGSPTTRVVAGNKVTALPTAPTSAACDNSKEFVGWTDAPYSHASTAPSILFTDAAGAPNVDDDVTYYAVFADAADGSSSKTYELTIERGDVPSSYTGTWSAKTATETGGGSGTLSVSLNGTNVMQSTASGHTTHIQFKASSTGFYNTTDLGTINSITTNNSDIKYYINSSSNPSSSGSGGYFRVYNNTSGARYTASIVINFTKTVGGIIYSNYTTTCCADPGLNYGTAPVTRTFGDAAFTNPLTNSHSVAVTYSSSDETVATVDSEGEVTILKVGSTTITASSIAQTVAAVSYCADEASYTLTVNKANISPTLTYTPNSVAAGSNTSAPTVGGNPGSGGVTYAITSATPAGCATIDAGTGVVSGVAVGSVTVTATVAATTNYNGGSATANVTITAASSWKLKGSWDSWEEHTMIEDAGVASYSISLDADSRFEFGFDGGSFYKNNGTIITTTSGWVFNTTDNNCHIHTGPAGTYTFAINTSTKAVTVTYPTVSHPNEHYVYFKNTNVWGTVYGYLANSGNDNKAAAWPGSVMQPTTTICGETYHYAALNAMSGTYNTIIFNNGNNGYGNQTSDLSTTGSLGKYNANQDANWHQFKYTISFDGNGNTDGSMSSITELCPGSNQALTSNAFTKDHYTFAGWHADVAVKVGESTIDAGEIIDDEVTIKDIQSDINLTAQWTPDTYTITKTLTNVANAGLPASFTYTGATTTALNSTFTVDGENFFLPSSITITMGGTPLTQGTDYTYNNSTGAFTFSAVITGNIVITATATAKLKSIAITTQPTTRAYLVGDVFSSTGAVVTATMGDGRTKAVTASATWTPAGALSAGTGRTVTATYTEAGIEKTATTTIDVYSVTVNKVDMDGNAIADAGVTATCSGRTLSQSVGSTNYKFNSWNVTAGGVTVSTNTITGTPTGNVTINAKFHDPITVTWKVGSDAASGGTSEVKYGTAIAALPSTPADNALASCGTNKFMGWTALGELKGTGNDAPADLFTTVGGATALTENTTYRAVFASSTSGAAAGTTIYSEDFSGYSADDQPNGSITNSHTGTTVYGGNTLTYSYSDGSGTTKIFAANLAGGTSPELLIAKYSGYFQIAGIPTGNASVLTLTYKQNGQSITSSVSGTGYSGGKSSSSAGTTTTDITVGTAETFTLTLTGPSGNNNVRLDDILITVKTAGTTAVDYQTGCCEAPPALSITSANSVATGGTVSLTSTGGNGGTVTWSVVNGTGTATVAGSTLTAGSIGTVTVKAHQDANTVLGTEYCAQDAEQAFTVVSATVNVTGVEVSPTTKAIVPGETFDITPTISPSNATDKSVSWTSSASDKASVSSGTVTGVAAGTATITCTTTDGSHTATTAVTVYGVTMQALDEDGNAIAVGGPGTPSRTGASISPAADAGNYVFKEWAISGASLGSSASTKANTITNPTGAVTVTAKYYKPRTVKWSVNGNDSYTAGGATTTVAYNGTISTVPSDPSGLACASTFIAWTDAAHNNGQTAKDDDSYYGSALYTAAGDFPNITAETTTFYAVFAEGGGAAVNTVMWSEDWTGATTSNGSTGKDAAKPSAQGAHTGKTVYGSATVTYSETDDNVYARADNTAKGGSAPELLISSNKEWTISGIPTAGAATLTLSFITNKTSLGTLTVATNEDGKTPTMTGSITGSSAPCSGSYTITTDGASTINITFGNTANTRLDDIDVKVATVSLTNYVTECDPNIVSVTYDANGGATSCTNTTTDKTEDFTVCSTEPTRDYYSFAGWLCSADDEVYAASATIDDAVIDADFSLTAQWTPVTYNISYELDGGTNNVGNPATYNVTTATITLQDPTKGHDRFEGWYSTYSAGVYSDPVTEIPLGSHDNITLYAKWTTRHHIEFFKEGVSVGEIWRADDENMEDAVAGQGSVPSDPSAPTACSSKVFVGWSESTIDGETDTEPGDLMKPAAGTVNADKHYHAVWANESSESGTVTVFEDALNISGTDAVTSRSGWSTISYVEANSGDGVKLSSKNNAATMTVDLSGKSLESTLIITFQVKQYSDESGYIDFGCLDDGTTASFSPSTISSITDATWTNKTCTVSTVNAATQSITLNGQAKARVYIRNFKITQTGTIYSYSAYSTSCCATNVTLSQNDPEHGTIAFGKTKVPTCGDKEVSLTITPAAGYQLHSYEVATGSGKVATKSVSPAISLDNNSSAAQNITLTFADEANGAYDVTASFSLMTVTSWTWTMHDGGGAIPDPLNLYVGQSARLDVVYIPDGVDASKKTYTRTKDDTYINFGGGSYVNYTTISGRASTGENTTAVTFTHADGPETVVNVKVLPLPLTHFADLVHGKAFADVAATIEDNALSATKTTPTSDDWTTPNANTCEENHLHLVGWIREDWPALVAYLNGTGDAPTTTAIVGAGNDGAGHAYYIAAGASIDVQTFDGVTFYAVWAEIK